MIQASAHPQCLWPGMWLGPRQPDLPAQERSDGEQAGGQSSYSLLSLDGVGGRHVVAGDVARLSRAERVGQPPVSLSECGSRREQRRRGSSVVGLPAIFRDAVLGALEASGAQGTGDQAPRSLPGHAGPHASAKADSDRLCPGLWQD